MSDLSVHYRKLAQGAREAAVASLLPRVRECHLQSALALDEIVSRIERTEANKARNNDARQG